MALALQSPEADWKRYPYVRSESKESFSQAIFRLMDMPEVGNEISGNLTVHQMLRLLYADQLSPVENLFMFEQFDRAQLRETVGRLLCGAYSNQLYKNELRLRDLNNELLAVSAELSSLIAVLGKAGEGVPLRMDLLE
jgi:hypothetical protein